MKIREMEVENERNLNVWFGVTVTLRYGTEARLLALCLQLKLVELYTDFSLSSATNSCFKKIKHVCLPQLKRLTIKFNYFESLTNILFFFTS